MVCLRNTTDLPISLAHRSGHGDFPGRQAEGQRNVNVQHLTGQPAVPLFRPLADHQVAVGPQAGWAGAGQPPKGHPLDDGLEIVANVDTAQIFAHPGQQCQWRAGEYVAHGCRPRGLHHGVGKPCGEGGGLVRRLHVGLVLNAQMALMNSELEARVDHREVERGCAKLASQWRRAWALERRPLQASYFAPSRRTTKEPTSPPCTT